MDGIGGGALGSRAREGAGGRELDPTEVGIGGHVKRLAVVAKAAVGRRLTGEDRAEVGTIGSENEDPAGASGEDVSAVDLEAVGKTLLPLLEELRAVEEGLAGIERAVGLDIEHLPDRRWGSDCAT